MNKRPRTGPIEKVVIHTNSGDVFEGVGGAKGLAVYLQGIEAGYQAVGDNVETIRMCADLYAVEAAGGINDYSVNYCLYAGANQLAYQWADAYSEAELRIAAKWIAVNWCKAYNIPARRLTPREVATNGVKGICGHLDVNLSGRPGSMWPGGHYDPGYSFPWPHFLALLDHELHPELPEDTMKPTDPVGSLANSSGGTGLLLAGGRLVISGSFKSWGDLITDHTVIVMGKNHAVDFEFNNDETAYWIAQADGGLHAYGPNKTYEGNFMKDIGNGQRLGGIVLGGNNYPKGVRWPDAKILQPR